MTLAGHAVAGGAADIGGGMELSAFEVVLLELLRGRGAMTVAQVHALGLPPTAFDLRRQLEGLLEQGLLETRLNLYVINDAGLAALKTAVAERRL